MLSSSDNIFSPFKFNQTKSSNKSLISSKSSGEKISVPCTISKSTITSEGGWLSKRPKTFSNSIDKPNKFQRLTKGRDRNSTSKVKKPVRSKEKTAKLKKGSDSEDGTWPKSDSDNTDQCMEKPKNLKMKKKHNSDSDEDWSTSRHTKKKRAKNQKPRLGRKARSSESESFSESMLVDSDEDEADEESDSNSDISELMHSEESHKPKENGKGADCNGSLKANGNGASKDSDLSDPDMFSISDSDQEQSKRSRLQKGNRKQESKIEKALRTARERKSMESAVASRKHVSRKVKNHQPKERWVCSTCTFDNSPDSTHCEMCDIKRPSKRAVAHEKRAKKMKAEFNKQPGDSESEFDENKYQDEEVEEEDDRSEASSMDDEDTRRDRAIKVLDKCSELSTILRQEIDSWRTEALSQASQAVNMGGISEEDSARTNLLEISTNNSDIKRKIITQEDIAYLCPGLLLKNYQLVGVNWMYVLHKKMVNGVLADEMGLGKTVQTIAFLAFLKDKQIKEEIPTQSHLIIVPASTLGNWHNELTKFCPNLSVLLYHGSQAERTEIRETIRAQKTQPDIFLSTYSYFQLESAVHDRKFLKSLKFGYMILDEAHCIKNQDGLRFQKLSAQPAQHRLLLSGTPVQNKLEELMSLLSFLMPKVFQGSTEALMEHLQVNGRNQVKSQNLKKIQSILAPFILRRLKSEVLGQLPSKSTEVEFVDLTGRQYEVYSNLTQKISGFSDSNMSAAAAHHLYTDLRKASNHPLLLRVYFNVPESMDQICKCLLKRGHFGDQATMSMIQKEVHTYSDFDLNQICCKYKELQHFELSETALYESAKFQRLHTLLPDLQEKGHRMLVFSQWTRTLDLLECLLGKLEMRFLRLDGSTDVRERQALITEFTHDTSIPVFLLSTRAGGLGINLTAADTVILHDLDWNPTNDQQAEDRCHRIGQTRPVQVIKMVTRGTVDEIIYNIGSEKTVVTARVLNEEEGGAQKRSGKPDSKTISEILLKALEKVSSAQKGNNAKVQVK